MMNRKQDILVIFAVCLVLLLGLSNAWYNFNVAQEAGTGARTIDRELILQKINEGQLSDQEALYYQQVERESDETKPDP